MKGRKQINCRICIHSPQILETILQTIHKLLMLVFFFRFFVGKKKVNESMSRESEWKLSLYYTLFSQVCHLQPLVSTNYFNFTHAGQILGLELIQLVVIGGSAICSS